MTNRRNFIKASIAAAITSSTFTNLSPLLAASSGPILRPKRLKSGDTIGLIAPGSNAWEDEEIEYAMDVLRSFGFKVKPGKHLFDRKGYLAGEDKNRAADVNQMFADKSIDGVYCLRGGYGSPRILPYLDFPMIKENPKALIGYSDITALLNAIYAKTGLITFHGPMPRENFTPYTVLSFKEVLFEGRSNIELATPPAFEVQEGHAEKDNRLTTVTPGKASGRLIGGNLSLMVKLIGTPYEPDYNNKILFLEDIDEAPYRVDGMLTHLLVAGRLKKLAGIVFGKCTDCNASGPSLSLEQVINDRLGQLNIPVLKGLMIGHIEDLATIPVGAMATLNASKKRLILKESVVS